jgi:hypothetical protein
MRREIPRVSLMVKQVSARMQGRNHFLVRNASGPLPIYAGPSEESRLFKLLFEPFSFAENCTKSLD